MNVCGHPWPSLCMYFQNAHQPCTFQLQTPPPLPWPPGHWPYSVLIIAWKENCCHLQVSILQGLFSWPLSWIPLLYSPHPLAQLTAALAYSHGPLFTLCFFLEFLFSFQAKLIYSLICSPGTSMSSSPSDCESLKGRQCLFASVSPRSSRKDQWHSFQGPVQNENVGPLLKKQLRILKW